MWLARFWDRIRRLGPAAFRMWIWLRALWRVLVLARVSVVFGSIGVLLLFDAQGKDSLVILADDDTGWLARAVFILALQVWGTSVWFWGRIAVQLDRDVVEVLDGETAVRAHHFFRVWVPRAAGVLALAGANAALLLSLIEGRALPGHWQNASDGNFFEYLGSLLDGDSRALFLVTAAASIATSAAIIWRRRLLRAVQRWRGRPLPAPAPAPRGDLREWKEIAPSYRRAAQALFWPAIILLTGISIFPLESAVLGSIVLFLIAACIWLALPGLLTLWLYAYRVPVISLGIVLGVGFSCWNDNHDVRTSSRLAGKPAPDAAAAHAWLASRPGAAEVFQQWRKEQTAWPGHPTYVPVVIVTTAGGGIRAALWTTEVLGDLDSAPNAVFRKRLFAISAVSGGAFGSAVYLGLTKDSCTGAPVPPLKDCARTVFRRDLLAPVSATFFYKDSVQHFAPIALAGDDRAASLERSFEQAYRSATLKSSLALPFHELWALKPGETAAQRRNWPILLMNGTSVSAGRRLIASNVRVDRDAFGYAIDVFQIIGEDVPVSTVANMAGRFPFVEPAGTLRFDCQRLPPKPSLKPGEREPDDARLPASTETLRALCKDGSGRIVFDHVVDGGYFENFGATGVYYLLDFLRRQPMTDGPASAAEGAALRLFPIVIQISSDPDLQPREGPKSPATPAPKALAWIQDFWAPLAGIFATRSARGEDSTYSLAQTTFGPDKLQGAYFHLAMCKRTTVEPPLGWVMSDRAHEVIQNEMMGKCHCNWEKIEVILGCLRGSHSPKKCAELAYAFSTRALDQCQEQPSVAQERAK